ncbi:MAG: response regulator [Lachnospiraceae bacterium]|nr:response regulator [Lachnospiraceae bacterium]
MEQKHHNKDYFGTSHLTILIVYTIFSVILIGESLLLGWETWALFLIGAALAASWIIHIRQQMPPETRLWLFAFLMMATAFFYGSHVTSTYDFGLVMSVIILIYVSTGNPGLITLAQVTYYLAMFYDIVTLILSGEKFDGLLITRTMLHVVVITLFSILARRIILKWKEILDKNEEEKAILTENTTRLNDFLANISHEIRTPINAVIGLTGVCVEKETDPEIKRDMLLVTEAGRRVGDQIGDVLDYSEIDMNSLAVNTEDYMLSSLLNDVVMEINPRKPKELELVIDVDPSVPSVMQTDVVKLKKILRHLIENGLKYTKEGGVYVRITSEEREYGINLQIDIRDTGIGMSREELERVFERFYQVNSGRTRSSSGLGLGLSIVNGFVRALKGFMTIDSAPGEGTWVRFSLPQKVVDQKGCMGVNDPGALNLGAYYHFDKFNNPHVRDYYNAMMKDLVLGLRVTMQRTDHMDGLKALTKDTTYTHLFVGKEEYEEDPAFVESLTKDTLVTIVANDDFVLPEGSHARIIPKPFYCFPVIAVLNTNVHDLDDMEEEKLWLGGVKALIVDDEPMNHVVAKGILARYGMEVFSVNSGEESIAFCREKDVDIVFMDHMMPGMDGVEAMQALRSDFSRARKDIPIVALTANAVSSAKEMFLSVGFDGFVSKPIELMELERVLRKVLPKSMIGAVPVDQDDTKKKKEREAKAEEVTLNEPEEQKAAGKYSLLEKLSVDSTQGLFYCQNDPEFYDQLLIQYAQEFPQKEKTLTKAVEEKDLRTYEVTVHAVKSTSKMIGAMHLSDAAKALEDAAKEQKEAVIQKDHSAMLEEYTSVAKAIMDLFGLELKTSEEGSEYEILEFGPEEDEVLEFAPEGGDAS